MTGIRITYTFVLLLSAAAFLSDSVQAKQASPEKKRISYAAYLSSLKQSLPELKSNDIDVLTAENDVKAAEAAGDVALTASGSHASDQQSQVPASLGKYQADTNTMSFGASKTFTTTGTSLSGSLDYTKDNYSGVISGSTAVPSLTLKVSQPLLYNFLGKVDRYSKHDAVLKAKIAKIERLENNKSTMNAYKKLFFEWQVYLKIVENYVLTIKSAEVQLNQIGRNLKAGISGSDDYEKAKATLLSYKQQYQDYLTTLNNIENQLSIYFDTSTCSPDESDFSHYIASADKNAFEYINFKKTRSHKVLALTLQDYQYAKGVYENKLLPTFDVYAEMTKKNLEGTSPASIRNVPDRDYSVGFEFSYSLGNNQAESDLEAVNIEIKSLNYEYSTTLNSYKKSLLKLKESSSGIKNQIKIVDSIMLTLKKELKAERRKYRQGRLDLSDLIDTQNSILTYYISSLNLKYELISDYIDYMDAVE